MVGKTVFCACCQRYFGGYGYYKVHLKSSKNVRCLRNVTKHSLRPGLRSPARRLPQVPEGIHEANLSYRRALLAANEAARAAMEAVEGGDFGVNVHQLRGNAHSSGLNGKNTDDSGVFDAGGMDTEEAIIDGEYFQYGISTEQSIDDMPSDDGPGEEMLRNFKEYVAHAKKNYRGLCPEYVAGVELMKVLLDKGAALILYDFIYAWHLEHMEADSMVSREVLMKKLESRYGMENSRPYEKKILLPHSQVWVKIVVHDVIQQIKSLLTDPRVQPGDYLFGFKDGDINNPFWVPDNYGNNPQSFTTVGDINSAMAYSYSYEELIRKTPIADNGRRKVLLPVFWYMDGCVMGQFDNLPLEAMKLSLGIFDGRSREKGWMWKPAGYITKFLKERSKAQEMIAKSRHVDANQYLSESDSDSDSSDEEEEVGFQPNVSYGDGPDEFDIGPATLSDDEEDDEIDPNADEKNLDPELPACNAQDLHAMMDCILESYREIQDRGGFPWDLPVNGIIHEVQFIPFVMFIKGDTVEHDKHCGSYNSRTKGVANLCRSCCCPTDRTDEPYEDYDRKSKGMIQALIDRRDLEALKGLSQHCIDNTWYKIVFGFHNDYGVHGACPVESLHWCNLGQFKYIRGMFFFQTGKDSKLSDRINEVACQIGLLLLRQSDRDMPRTKFSKGIKKGKLQGHEMTGLMVVLAATLRSSVGRNILLTESRGNQKKYFGKLQLISDWIMLIETLLQMEAWMMTAEMEVTTVRRFEVKMKEIMSMTKQIGKREEKMGFKTFNFHAGKHIADDILSFGVPRNVNTRSNESHHKSDKRNAKRTQRRPDKFDMQCAARIHDTYLVELAIQDREGRPLWDYYDGYSHEETTKKEYRGPSTGGTRAQLKWDPNRQVWSFTSQSRMANKHRFRYKSTISGGLVEIAERVSAERDHTVIKIFTELTVQDGQIYRASPSYSGKPWLDWAWVNLDPTRDDSVHPCHIQCFLDLTDMKRTEKQEDLKPDIYMMIEPASPVTDDKEIAMSDLFIPYTKEINNTSAYNHPITLQRYLPVSRIVEPCIMIPDLENPNERAYLHLRPRYEWADLFKEWINATHYRDFDDPQA